MTQTVKLGRTGIVANKNGFGALPIQRVDEATAVDILRHAYNSGVNYFDTARIYSDSEAKIRAALSPVRDSIVIASKTMSLTPAGIREDLQTSLRELGTDYIDVYQLHNPPFCPLPGDGSGLYEELLAAQRAGKIRHIGFTNHRLAVARQAVESGLYATLQFPFSYLADEPEREIVALCAQHEVGFIAMKSLSGGLITDAAAAYGWMAGHETVLPIWGIQHRWELQQFLDAAAANAPLTPSQRRRIERDRAELAGEFCRGCGYCQPCPAGIEIQTCARISLLLRRSPAAGWLGREWQEKMQKIKGCTGCGACAARCPYNLDTPALLRRNYRDYLGFLPTA